MGKEEEQGRGREIARENQLCHGICSSELWELRGFPAGRAGAEAAGCWGGAEPWHTRFTLDAICQAFSWLRVPVASLMANKGPAQTPKYFPKYLLHLCAIPGHSVAGIPHPSGNAAGQAGRVTFAVSRGCP